MLGQPVLNVGVQRLAIRLKPPLAQPADAVEGAVWQDGGCSTVGTRRLARVGGLGSMDAPKMSLDMLAGPMSGNRSPPCIAMAPPNTFYPAPRSAAHAAAPNNCKARHGAALRGAAQLAQHSTAASALEGHLIPAVVAPNEVMEVGVNLVWAARTEWESSSTTAWRALACARGMHGAGPVMENGRLSLPGSRHNLGCCLYTVSMLLAAAASSTLRRACLPT